MRKYFIGLLLITAGTFFILQTRYGHFLFGYHRFVYTPERYEAFTKAIQTKQKKLQVNFEKLNTTNQKQYLEKASKHLKTNVPKLFNYWYGTKWDLNGMTQVPGHGKIACGYFVTTILQDAGFRMSRIKMSQMAAEPLLKKLVSPQQLQRFYKIPLEKFVQKVRKRGTGLYLVGLDTHIGFLWFPDKEEPLWFVHSSSLGWECVKREEALKSRTLKNSKYKVLARLDNDEKFLRRWFP